MYYPHFRKSRSHVPILKKKEINETAELYAKYFMPQIIDSPQPFNIEGFIEFYLELQLDFQFLSNNGMYLGMTVFNDTNRVIVYSPKNNRAEYFHADQGTIIIDNRLLTEKKMEHRYRFTLGHECGHWIYHRCYFEYDPNQLTLFDEFDMPFIQCRETNQNHFCCQNKNRDDLEWLEWQADMFSAGILMPSSSVHCLLQNGDKTHLLDENSMIKLVSDVFNVSEQAAYLRLVNLGFIQVRRNEAEYKQLSFL